MLTNSIHVNVPYPLLKDRTGFLVEQCLNPEIYLSSDILDTIKKEEFAGACERLKKGGLSITFHAPYLDMSP